MKNKVLVFTFFVIFLAFVIVSPKTSAQTVNNDVEQVIEKINSIPSVVTTQDVLLVQSAYNEYTSLNEVDKDSVDNYDVLESVINTINEAYQSQNFKTYSSASSTQNRLTYLDSQSTKTFSNYEENSFLNLYALNELDSSYITRLEVSGYYTFSDEIHALRLGSTAPATLSAYMIDSETNYFKIVSLDVSPWRNGGELDGEISNSSINVSVYFDDNTALLDNSFEVSSDRTIITIPFDSYKTISTIELQTTANVPRVYINKLSLGTNEDISITGSSFDSIKLNLGVNIPIEIYNTLEGSFGIISAVSDIDITNISLEMLENAGTISGTNYYNNLELRHEKTLFFDTLYCKKTILDFNEVVYSMAYYISPEGEITYFAQTSHSINELAKKYYFASDNYILNNREVNLTKKISVLDNLEGKNAPLDFSTLQIPGPKTTSYEEHNFTNELTEDGPLTEYALPSTGSPKILVIPVSLGSKHHESDDINEIRTTFSGTSEQTGWESLTSYYQKSSYGKLNLDVTVLDNWFYAPKSVDDYSDEYRYQGKYPDEQILVEALDSLTDSMDLSEFDSDLDGVIDAVWLVYDAPYEDVPDTCWWAWKTDYTGSQTFGGMDASSYAWASKNFMHYSSDQRQSDSTIAFDAHTYIHETGHLMGLDDYYDYDDYPSHGGLYGADMMDYAVGDHGATSKLLLNWVNPMVITSSKTVDINDFESSGDVLLISKTTPNSIYQEYFLVDLYTNTNLQAHDQIFRKDKLDYGIRVTHVCAQKNGLNTYSGTNYQTGFMYNNTDGQINFVSLMTDTGLKRSDTRYTNLSTDDLFSLDSPDFASTYKNLRLTDGTYIFFDLSIKAMTSTSATIEITFN